MYRPEDHGPILQAPRLLGCSCGWQPATTPVALGNVRAGYKAHAVRALGRPNDWAVQPTLYGYDEQLGQRV